MIRTVFLLWRMLRILERAPLPVGETQTRGAEIRILYEPEQSYRARAAIALSMGEPRPSRETMHEVSFYPIVGRPCYTQRGATLAEALKKALDAPFPAPLS